MGTIQRCTYTITNSRPERTAGVVLAAVSVTFSADISFRNKQTQFAFKPETSEQTPLDALAVDYQAPLSRRFSPQFLWNER